MNVGALKMRAKPSGEEKPEHPKIAGERPERVPKGRRPIVLDPKMSRPGKPIAEHRRGKEPAPIEADHRERDGRKREKAPQVVQCPCGRACVGPQVAKPEFVVGQTSA